MKRINIDQSSKAFAAYSNSDLIVYEQSEGRFSVTTSRGEIINHGLSMAEVEALLIELAN